jgi:hypothetical protein
MLRAPVRTKRGWHQPDRVEMDAGGMLKRNTCACPVALTTSNHKPVVGPKPNLEWILATVRRWRYFNEAETFEVTKGIAAGSLKLRKRRNELRR